MRLLFVSVGKPKAPALADAARDYLGRLQRQAQAEWATVASDDVPPRASDAIVDRCLAHEGERILARVPAGALLVALDRTGQTWSSRELADALAGWQQRERHVVFAVGSAHGLHRQVLEQSRLRLSLSRFTMPHELALLVLLEQVYRAHTILRNEPYHK